MKRYTWGGMPCVRFDKLLATEEHPCYYCGKPFSIDTTIACSKCGFMICPNCKKCVCNTSKLEQTTLAVLRDNYCCDPSNFSRGFDESDKEYLISVPHFVDALNYCRKQEGINV